MGEEEPESENGLGKDIEDSVCNDLGVNIGEARSISNTPNTRHVSVSAGPKEVYEPTLGRQSKG